MCTISDATNCKKTNDRIKNCILADKVDEMLKAVEEEKDNPCSHKLTFSHHCQLFYYENFNIKIPEHLFKKLYQLYILWAFSCISGRTKKNIEKEDKIFRVIKNVLQREEIIS